MFKVMKNQGNIVRACRLGEPGGLIEQLMREGRIVERESGIFEVFSREAADSRGEIAYMGDYIKVDSAGMPYPNKKDFFEKNHRYLGEDKYEQSPALLDAWADGEDMCEEVEFLIAEKGLAINKSDENKYYTAPLWGTILSAAKDAVIIFYRVERDEKGVIQDIDFNFVQREEFDKTYSILMKR